MSLFLPIFEWAEQSVIGQTIAASRWLFPFIEAFHLVALGLLGGVVLIVDMRLLGLGLGRQPVSRMARSLQPWLTGGLVVMLVSGFLLFSSESAKLYPNLPFQIKMVFLAMAILFTFTIRRRVVFADDDVHHPGRAKVVAVTSMFLWSVVGLMGRGIGFW